MRINVFVIMVELKLKREKKEEKNCTCTKENRDIYCVEHGEKA